MAKEYSGVKLDVTFTKASTRENIISAENIALSFGKLAKWYTDFAWSAWTAPDVEVTGTGNAITSASYGTGANANKLTLTKGSTFLTQHPTIPTQTDTTSTSAPSFGGTFTAVDSVTRDSNGHVLKINTKTITVPNKTMGAATSSAAGSIGLVPAPAAGKQTSFLRGDGTWVVPTNTTYTAGTGLALSGTTFNHSNSVTARTDYMQPYIKYDAQGHVTGSSYWMATAKGTDNTAGWVKVATIKHKMTYDNTPFLLDVSQRGNTISYRIHIRWNNANSVDPPLGEFLIASDHAWESILPSAYIIKSDTSTWDLYIKKLDNYEAIAMRLQPGLYFNDHTEWTWKDEQTAASAITGGTEATKKVYSTTDHTHAYLPLAGGTMDTDAEITIPRGTTDKGKVTSTGMFFRVGAAGWARGLNLFSDDFSTQIGAFGLYGASNATAPEIMFFGKAYDDRWHSWYKNKYVITDDGSTLFDFQYQPANLDSGYSGSFIQLKAAEKYGYGIIIGRKHGGTTIIGAGESANGLCSVIENSLNPWGSSALGYGAENLYNISDTSIYFISGANSLSTSAYTDWTDIKTALFDNNGYFRPSKDKNGQIGASNYRWNYGYFDTVDANTVNITNSAFGPLTITRSGATYAAGIIFKNSNGSLGSIGMTGSADGGLMRWSASGASTYTVCDTGNMNTIIPSTKYALVVDETSDFASYAWHKFAEITLSDAYADAIVTFLVSKTWGQLTKETGILTAHIRTGSTKVFESAQFNWLVAGDTINPAEFVMVYTNTASTSCKVELWHKQTTRYDGWIFKVLKEHSRSSYGANPWALFVHSGHGSAAYTTGTGTIVSSLNTIANTAASSNKINTDAGDFQTPVYFSDGVPVAVNIAASGACFGVVPQVRKSDGVMEIGRYIDFHSTNAGTTDYDVRLDASSTSLLTLSSNSGTPTFRISGTLPRLNFKQTTSGSAYENASCGISAYPANTSGVNLVIQSSGNMYIGGGESVTAMYTAVKTSGANPYTNLKRSVDSGGTASSITPAIGNEKMFITSDEQIFFAVGANGLSTSAYTDWTNLKTVLLDSDGFFRPSIDNKGQIGTSDYRWKAVHATEVVGNAVGKDGFIAYPEDGTFSGSDQIPISCITITLPIDTSVITSDNCFKVGFKVDMWCYAPLLYYTSDTLTIAGLIMNNDPNLAWFSVTALSNSLPFNVSFGFLNSKAQIQITIPNVIALYAPEIRIRDIIVIDGFGNHNTFAENKSGWIIESNSDFPAGYEETRYILNSSLTSQPGIMLYGDLIPAKAVIDYSGLLYAGKSVGFYITTDATTPSYILDGTAANTVSAYAYGDYTIFNIKSKDYARLSFQTTKSGKTYTASGIIMYPLKTSGMTALFSCGGNMVIGGGEFANNAYARKDSSNASHVGYDNIATTENEKLYLGADSEVQIISNAGGIHSYNNNDHKVWTFGTDGTLTTPGAIKDSLGNQHSPMIQQNLRSSSNCVALTWWIVDGAASVTTRPGIYYHNAGGDSTDKGAIILQPYHSRSNPWESGHPIGLYIGKGILQLDGTNVSLEGHTHNYAGSSSAGGSATTVQGTLTNPKSETNYPIPFHETVSTGAKTLRNNDGLIYTTKEGTASDVGWSVIRVGNGAASGIAGNKYGVVRIYSQSTSYIQLKANSVSSAKTQWLSAMEGTICCLNKNSTSYWGLYDGDGVASNWIRTTTYGFIPYQSGGLTSPHSALGTSTWSFSDVWSQKIHGVNLDVYNSAATYKHTITSIASANRTVTLPDTNCTVGTGFFYVVGTQNAKTKMWTGNLPIPQLYDGLTIAFYLPYDVVTSQNSTVWDASSNTNVWLQLTLSNGQTTDWVPCYWTNQSRITTHFSSGATILLTYWSTPKINGANAAAPVSKQEGGKTVYWPSIARWTRADYNSNSDTKVNVTLGTTTKAYLLGTSTTPTSTAAAVTSIADTGVYLSTTAGEIVATTFNGTATKINEASTDNTTAKTYSIPFNTDPSTASSAGSKTLGLNSGLMYRSKEGTASAEGEAVLVLGNGTAKGTAGNKTGKIKLYSEKSSSYNVTIQPATEYNGSVTQFLPCIDGEIQVSQGQILLYNGTVSLTSSTQITVSGDGYLADYRLLLMEFWSPGSGNSHHIVVPWQYVRSQASGTYVWFQSLPAGQSSDATSTSHNNCMGILSDSGGSSYSSKIVLKPGANFVASWLVRIYALI